MQMQNGCSNPSNQPTVMSKTLPVLQSSSPPVLNTTIWKTTTALERMEPEKPTSGCFRKTLSLPSSGRPSVARVPPSRPPFQRQPGATASTPTTHDRTPTNHYQGAAFLQCAAFEESRSHGHQQRRLDLHGCQRLPGGGSSLFPQSSTQSPDPPCDTKESSEFCGAPGRVKAGVFKLKLASH